MLHAVWAVLKEMFEHGNCQTGNNCLALDIVKPVVGEGGRRKISFAISLPDAGGTEAAAALATVRRKMRRCLALWRALKRRAALGG